VTNPYSKQASKSKPHMSFPVGYKSILFKVTIPSCLNVELSPLQSSDRESPNVGEVGVGGTRGGAAVGENGKNTGFFLDEMFSHLPYIP